MKKVQENKYPNSAKLFRFCKEALEARYEGNVKVIDQDVGAILGYDPADCSHWKKGKKNIRALATLRGLADHLKIDERILIEIASGKLDLEEAMFEFKGYGEFSLPSQKLEILKKEFFKTPSKWIASGEADTAKFEKLFQINRPLVIDIANKIITKGNFSESPIYIPEVFSLFDNCKLIKNEGMSEYFHTNSNTEGVSPSLAVEFKSQEVKPLIRFVAAKELYRFLVKSGHELTTAIDKDIPNEILEIQSNLFASALLIPGDILKKEVLGVNHITDIIVQLSNHFWVSKSLMNKRLQDYLKHLS